MIVKNKYGSCQYAFESDYVHIFNLFVIPEFRLQGKARELLQITISKIREKGYTGDIQIVSKSQKLKLFYDSLGLKVYDYYG